MKPHSDPSNFVRGTRILSTQLGIGVLERRLLGGSWAVRFNGKHPGLRTLSRDELAAALVLSTPEPPTPPTPRGRLANSAPKRAIAAAPVHDPEVPTRATRPTPSAATPPMAQSCGAFVPSIQFTARTKARFAVPEAVECWQTLEALRLGIVPRGGSHRYTIGRKAELRDLTCLLNEGQGARFVWGSYGAGKTHLLDALEHEALSRGLVVARLTLSPEELPPSHPNLLWRAILDNACAGARGERSVFEVLSRLVDSPNHRQPRADRGSRFLSAWLVALASGDEGLEAQTRAWLSGEPTDTQALKRALVRHRWGYTELLKLSDFRTYGRVYTHLIGTLATWVKDAGHHGLLVLLDEVERVDALSRTDLKHAFETLRYLAAASLPADELAFDPDDLYKGGHAVHQALPLRFRDDQPLMLVAALTPLAAIEDEFRDIVRKDLHALKLGPLRSPDLPALVERIAELYSQVYPEFHCTPSARQSLIRSLQGYLAEGTQEFRGIVREIIFAFDHQRLSKRRSQS